MPILTWYFTDEREKAKQPVKGLEKRFFWKYLIFLLWLDILEFLYQIGQ